MRRTRFSHSQPSQKLITIRASVIRRLNEILPVKVFEVRDVDWARPVMASCTIAVVSIALTEICPKMYGCVVTLANKEWRILAKSLAYENHTTGSAVLAIFTAGKTQFLSTLICI